MIDQTWLNPDIAETQIVTLALVFLASLIILPLIFGTVMYLLLSFVARVREVRKRLRHQHAAEDEAEDD